MPQKPVNILFLMHPGTNSRDAFVDIIDGYSDAGCRAFVLDLGSLWQSRDDAKASPETRRAAVVMFGRLVYRFVKDNSIDLCVAMWNNGVSSLPGSGERNFFESIGLPHLMHWLDAPQWAGGGVVLKEDASLLNGPHCFHYINNPGTAAEMQSVLGFSNVLALPNASNPKKMRPSAGAGKEFTIAFNLGSDSSAPSPAMLEELSSDTPDLDRIRRMEADGLKPRMLKTAEPIFGDGANSFVESMISAQLSDRHMPFMRKLQALSQRAPRPVAWRVADAEIPGGLCRVFNAAPLHRGVGAEIRGSMALKALQDGRLRRRGLDGVALQLPSAGQHPL